MRVVLAPVDQHFAGAQRAESCGTRPDRARARSRRRARCRRSAGLGVGDRAAERNVDLEALGAGCLHETREAKLAKVPMSMTGDGGNSAMIVAGEPGWRSKTTGVGPRQIGGDGERNVQLERREVREPEERGRVADQGVVDRPLRSLATAPVRPSRAGVTASSSRRKPCPRPHRGSASRSADGRAGAAA